MSLPTPRLSTRGTTEYVFAEVQTLLGPVEIGETGDNRYETLYGVPYALILDEDRVLRLFRGAVGGGSYEEVTTGLPTAIFGPALPETARRFTMAFDQSARAIVAYEDEGTIRVTRWETDAYVQNVTFAGHDPALLMDATILDPRGYPTGPDDGWSIKEVYDAGGDLEASFEWLAEDPATYRTNPVTDSDVLLFYVTPDRTEVKVRVQRQLYATVNDVASYAEPIVLDRAIALYAKWQLLVSDAAGDPLANMLVSETYVGDWLVTASHSDELELTAGAPTIRHEKVAFPYDAGSDELDLGVSAPPFVDVGSLAVLDVGGDELDLGVNATAWEDYGILLVESPPGDELDVDVGPYTPWEENAIVGTAADSDEVAVNVHAASAWEHKEQP